VARRIEPESSTLSCRAFAVDGASESLRFFAGGPDGFGYALAVGVGNDIPRPRTEHPDLGAHGADILPASGFETRENSTRTLAQRTRRPSFAVAFPNELEDGSDRHEQDSLTRPLSPQATLLDQATHGALGKTDDGSDLARAERAECAPMEESPLALGVHRFGSARRSALVDLVRASMRRISARGSAASSASAKTSSLFA
jgi:hypothetical protein